MRESLIIHMKDYYPKDNIETAWNLGCLGNIYGELGDYQNAKTLIEQCSNILRKIMRRKSF